MNCLHDYIRNPENPENNFKLAVEYEAIGQTAAAISFYLRAAERSKKLTIQYVSLIRMALCFKKQGRRNLTVKTLLEQASGVMPNMPQAYYFLSQHLNQTETYHEAYLFSTIGLKNTNFNNNLSEVLPEYPGEYGLIFEKSLAAWSIGLGEEARQLLFTLKYNYKLDDVHAVAVTNNINNIGLPNHNFYYTRSFFKDFKYPFNGLDLIDKSYAQSYQDMFVLSVLNGKTNGTYLEIGSHDPFYNNNTALLELNFGWTGLSVDINQSMVDKFNAERKNHAICHDALHLDYKPLIETIDNSNNAIIDYLQVDCDPPIVTFEILKKIIETGTKFRVITFEHDNYRDDTHRARIESRQYLETKGYRLVVNDVAFNKFNSFEDWWVLDEVVTDMIKDLKDVNFVEDIFLN
jgi:tetratricopeptide (TPR) repeat protein